ncbi:MAG: hypothetical protein F6K22_14405 [Okeania sp. SIO2F4]|uniref:hypothetical protein n=1 Tax=Okeania sp. SIO2F4 TaxID=2607790 RepID=UPI00142BFDDA|nr:hypothetical protein [Okeania sp. SIO2F4]NES03929.1 hypothetical protein [Okeania sp. SIO2F4]
MAKIHTNQKLIPTTTACTTINTNTSKAKTSTIKYDFEVSPYRGELTQKNYYGSFSFNCSELTGNGVELIKIDNFDFRFLGIDYGKTDLLFAEAVFRDGDFLGLTASGADFSFICGFFNLSEASFAYNVNCSFGAANVTFSLRKVTNDNFATVFTPEPNILMKVLV